MSKDKARKVLNVFLIIGMLVSLFLLYEHFSPSASKFCTFGANLDCGIVNKSPYANLDGISFLLTIDYGLPLPLVDISGINLFFDLITANAFLGFLTLLFVFLLNTKYKNKKFLWIDKDKGTKWIRGLLIFGLIYGLYLFYIQHSILKTYCIFCLALDVVIASSVAVAFKIKK
jgi:uncharacterized membrane protein